MYLQSYSAGQKSAWARVKEAFTYLSVYFYPRLSKEKEFAHAKDKFASKMAKKRRINHPEIRQIEKELGGRQSDTTATPTENTNC